MPAVVDGAQLWVSLPLNMLCPVRTLYSRCIALRLNASKHLCTAARHSVRSRFDSNRSRSHARASVARRCKDPSSGAAAALMPHDDMQCTVPGKLSAYSDTLDLKGSRACGKARGAATRRPFLAAARPTPKSVRDPCATLQLPPSMPLPG